MECTTEDRGGFVALSPSGKIDSSTAQAFEEALLGQLTGQSRSVLVDLSDVSFVSSAGLRVFLLGAKKIKGSGLRLVLCAPQPSILKVFQMSGFDRILDIQEDRASGEARMG